MFGYQAPEPRKKPSQRDSTSSAAAERLAVLHPELPFQPKDVVIFRSAFDGNRDFGLAGAWDGRVAVVQGAVRSWRYPAIQEDQQRAHSLASAKMADTGKEGMEGWTYDLRFIHRAGHEAPCRFRIEKGRGEGGEAGDDVNPYPGRTILHELPNDVFQALSGTLERSDGSLTDRLKNDLGFENFEHRLSAVETKLDEILNLLRK